MQGEARAQIPARRRKQFRVELLVGSYLPLRFRPGALLFARRLAAAAAASEAFAGPATGGALGNRLLLPQHRRRTVVTLCCNEDGILHVDVDDRRARTVSTALGRASNGPIADASSPAMPYRVAQKGVCRYLD